MSMTKQISNTKCPMCDKGRLHFYNFDYKKDSISTLDFKCDNPECNYIFKKIYNIDRGKRRIR